MVTHGRRVGPDHLLWSALGINAGYRAAPPSTIVTLDGSPYSSRVDALRSCMPSCAAGDDRPPVDLPLQTSLVAQATTLHGQCDRRWRR
jgi:hypothetical protein